MKERIVVICPGRGTYTRESSGYLKTHCERAKSQIAWMDEQRREVGLPTLMELDVSPFKIKIHMAGEHASTLIYACSLSDFLSIDQKNYEIVAITGNSMGWYIALGLSNVLTIEDTYYLIDVMGSMMKDGLIGGQIIYPIMDENWKIDEVKRKMIHSEVEKVGATISIILGGYLVIGGEQKSLDQLLFTLPKIDTYPIQIPLHGAFHTGLMGSNSKNAQNILSDSMFHKPQIPLVDGRGNIWSPFSSDKNDLWKYTLDNQVTKPYNFTHAVTVALKEFCPDKLVLLGPGNSLGGVIGQIMIQNNWLGVDSKKTFLKHQDKSPFLISMGIEDQRKFVV